VRTQRGWILFFAGILISTFLGGAVRFLLSPTFVRQWVEDIVSRSQPKFTFDFSDARMSFGRGWIPQIAIELHDLNVRAKDPCITGAEVHVNEVAVPLNLRHLVQGRIRFGGIDADQVTYWYRPKRCETPSAEQPFDVNNEIAPLETFFQHRWSKEVVNTTRILDEVDVTELRFINGEDKDPLFFLRDVQLSFYSKEREAELRFDFWPGKTLGGEQPFGPTGTVIRIAADSLKWTAGGNLKEGQIHSEGQWAVDKSRYDFHLHWKDVPLQNFMALIYHWNFSSLHEFKTTNEWFSCGFSSKGEVRTAASNTVTTDTCEIYGDLGNAKLQPLQLKPKQLAEAEYDLQAKNLDVRRFSLGFGYENWSSYLTKMGTFSGQIKSRLQGAFTAAGTIKGIEIYWGDFGLPSERGTIDELSVKAAVHENEFNMNFSDLKGKNLPRGAKVNIDAKIGSTHFDLTAPTMEFGMKWPLVAEIAKFVPEAKAGLILNNFEFSFNKNEVLDWKMAANHGGVIWQGHGVLMDSHELRGDVTVKHAPQPNQILKLTGILREPVVIGDQTP
jgi:hypothetical protein